MYLPQEDFERLMKTVLVFSLVSGAISLIWKFLVLMWDFLVWCLNLMGE
jgi:hypothetical protein